jgi:hypothetical protein
VPDSLWDKSFLEFKYRRLKKGSLPIHSVVVDAPENQNPGLWNLRATNNPKIQNLIQGCAQRHYGKSVSIPVIKGSIGIHLLLTNRSYSQLAQH